jgi:hypothetical protein
MRELIARIFEESNYKISQVSTNKQYFFAASTDDKKVSYYVVLFIDMLKEKKDIIASINQYYNEIKMMGEDYDPRMDKNSSMLICLKRDHMEPDEEINKIIFQIEEDPYFFKKNVLTYTETQVKEINKQLTINNPNVLDHLYKILNENQKFEKFKSNPYKESVYHLVSKLFIKLSFLHLRSFSRNLEDLSSKIDSLLQEDDLLEFKNKALENRAAIHSDDEDVRSKVLSFIGVGDDDEI